MREQFDAADMAKRWERLKKEGRVISLADVLKVVQSENKTRLVLTRADQKLLKGMKIKA